MSKLNEAIEILLSDQPEQSNAEIAARIGCDEGIVRRARNLVRVKVLEEENARLKDELGGTDKEAEGLYGVIDTIDNQIGNALEAVGKLPGKPAGFPDRVDAITSLVVELSKELARYRRASRPRPRKHDNNEPLPLWERIGPEGEIIPTVPILEIHS